jgi:hypothetical protein
MTNKRQARTLQDTAVFCGAVIKNVRNGKEFSFQKLYTEVTGKQNPNRAYLLRDALVATKVIHVRRDKSLCLSKENWDNNEVVTNVLNWIDERNTTPKEEKKEEPVYPIGNKEVKKEILLSEATLMELTEAIKRILPKDTSYTIYNK